MGQNVDTLRAGYEAFGRGDLEGASRQRLTSNFGFVLIVWTPRRKDRHRREAPPALARGADSPAREPR